MSGSVFWSGRPRRQSANPSPNLGPHWINSCQRTKTGGPIPNLFNTTLAFSNDPEWAGRLRYDEMRRTTIIDDHPVQDIDHAKAQLWLQENGIPRIGPDAVRDAFAIIADQNKFNPLRDWLDSLVWDQQDRLFNWIPSYLGVTPSEYATQISAKFLISMVARVYQPGCKADHMLVLRGPQSLEKSKVCKILGGDYFSSSIPDLASDYVRVSMHLRGKWLIEVGELHAFFNNRVDTARLKDFITQPEEIYTPKFARQPVNEPRTCLFVGTTNKQTFMRDETGNRRIWPTPCGTINLDALTRDRDQLLAEAVVRFRADEPW